MKKLILCISIIFIFLSCKKKDDEPTPVALNTATTNSPPTVTFPFIKDNNQWKYDYTALINNGTLEMVTDSIAPNLFKVTSIYDATDSEAKYWFVSGPYLKGYEDGKTKANSYFIYKLNPSVGDTWKNIDTGNEITYYNVTNNDTTIVCSFGSFEHCKKIKVTFNYAFNTQYEYWNDTYGLVLQTGFLALDLTDKNFRVSTERFGNGKW